MKVNFLRKDIAKNKLYYSKAFTEYFNFIHPNTILEKTGNSSKSIIKYLDRVSQFKEHHKIKIENAIQQLPKSSLTDNVWTFICLKNNTEKNWPFTIENYILCTCDFIDSIPLNRLSFTLAHEKIHNLQWIHNHMFTTLYLSLGFKNIAIDNLNSIISYANPDGLQTPKSSWGLEIRDKLYLPIMIYSNNNIYKKLFLLEKKNQKYHLPIIPIKYKCEKVLQQIIPETDASQCYHPHEMLADLGAFYIVKGTTKNYKIDHFFDLLTKSIKLGD